MDMCTLIHDSVSCEEVESAAVQYVIHQTILLLQCIERERAADVKSVNVDKIDMCYYGLLPQVHA